MNTLFPTCTFIVFQYMIKLPMQWWGAPSGGSDAAPITDDDVSAIDLVCAQNQITPSRGRITFLEPKNEPVLYIYFAPKAHRALVLRVYKHTTEMILWNTDTDVFQRGQWTLSGKLRTTVSTISNDGKYFHYKLCKNKGMLLINAISEIPFFTAREIHNDSYAEDISKGRIPADYEGHNKLSMTSGQSLILTLGSHDLTHGFTNKVPYITCKIIADRGRIFKLDLGVLDAVSDGATSVPDGATSGGGVPDGATSGGGVLTYRLILDTTNDTFVNIPAPYTTKIKPAIIKKF